MLFTFSKHGDGDDDDGQCNDQQDEGDSKGRREPVVERKLSPVDKRTLVHDRQVRLPQVHGDLLPELVDRDTGQHEHQQNLPVLYQVHWLIFSLESHLRQRCNLLYDKFHPPP